MHITRTLLFISILLASCLHTVSGYTILGGLDSKKSKNSKDDHDDDDSTASQTLRHLAPPRTLRLRTSAKETWPVSMAGTLWEASPLLADYVTNPACPVEAFQRMWIHDTNDGNNNNGEKGNNGKKKKDSRVQVQPSTVVELGSGIGLASIAAALLGCRVYATDGSPSSIRLLNENFSRYASDCDIKPQASILQWGDIPAINSLIQNELLGQYPDVVMASDVVYLHSARDELSETIRQLCPPNHLSGRVLIAHRWRVDVADEESFFTSFEDEFDVEEVGIEYMPPDEYYRTKSLIDMKYPISIYEMRRKC